jgi:hypothetical protein
MTAVFRYAAVVLKHSPILYWPMQDTSGTTVVDASGNGRDGTQTGVQLGVSDNYFNSDPLHLSFNIQSSDHISIADAAWQDITGDFTIAVWWKGGTLTTNSRVLFGNVVAQNNSADAPTTERFGLAIYNNLLYGLIYDGTTVSTVISPAALNSVHTSWHLFAFTRSGSTLKLYRDGALWQTGTGTANSTSTANTDGLRVGAHNGDVNKNSIGQTTELMLFSSALTATEIDALYDAALGVTGVVSISGEAPVISGYNHRYLDAVLALSPTVALPLQETSGTLAGDVSGNARNFNVANGLVNDDSGPFIVQPNRCFYNATGDNLSVYVADATWMDAITQTCTLQIWAKAVSGQSGARVVWGFGSTPGVSQKVLLLWEDGRYKAFLYYSDFTSDTVQTTNTYEDSSWHLITVVREYGVGVSIYVDTMLDTFSAVSTAKTLYLGTSAGMNVYAQSSHTTNSFVGYAAWACLYPTALTSAQIGGLYTAAMDAALAASAASISTVIGDLSSQAGITDLNAQVSAVASATGAVQMAQSLVADAIARASALGHMPTPGPGFGCWTRSAWPFARYIGRAVSFGYRPYYDEASALAGTAQAAATATGDLSLTVIGIAGNAIVQVAVVGDLGINMAEALGGGAVVSSTVTGDLQTDNISGAAAGLVTATGQTGIATPLSAAAVTRAIAAGTPSVLVPLGATAQVINAVTGALLGAVPIAGDADVVASATAVVNMLQSFTGSAAARAAAVASLTIGASMSGAAAAVGTVTGELGVGVDLDGDAQARASASGATGVSTSLAGQAVSQAALTGTLKDISTPADGPCYAVNLATGAATTLSNFGFEKLSRAHAALYGLKSGTVYQLAGDTDPGPTNIDATIRLSPMVMPTMYLHRLHYMYIRAREVDGITAIPVYDETVGYRYDTVADARGGLRVTKVNTGNGNSWHSLGLIVKNKNGGKLDLAGVEFVINQLVRRTK